MLSFPPWMVRQPFCSPLPFQSASTTHHILQFGLCRVLTEGSHHGSELLDGDGSISILVKERESLLELWEW